MLDELGKRMKEKYELRTRTQLPARTYTIVRLDGRAFHTYTRGLKRPYDGDLLADMQETTKTLCAGVSGCVFGYTQSDEISLLLTDFASPETQGFFDGNIQKIVSITASIATAKFNILRLERQEQGRIGRREEGRVAHFDSRVFTIPDRIEVENYFIWRGADATRNALQMCAQALYSPKQLHGRKTAELPSLIELRGDDFSCYPSHFRHGSLISKEYYSQMMLNRKTQIEQLCVRAKWSVIPETPRFSSDEGRTLLKKLIPKREE